MNIFAIFMEFSLTLREATKRSDNFYFLTFSEFSNLFWLRMKPYWYFSIFWIFLQFFWNFLLPVGKEWNVAIIFIFYLSQHFPTYFGLEWSRNGIFEFFCYFFLIFYSVPGRNETKRYFLFSLFLGLFRPILAWNESIMVFFNFFCYFFLILY